MLGKKMSNSSSSKARSSGGGLPGTSMPRTNSKTHLQATATSSSLPSTSPASPDSQMPIAHIKGVDNFKLLPRYSAALGRPHDDSMPAEDLDAIQLELEMLLSTVAQRSRALKYEFESLDREDKREKKGKFIEKQPSSPPGKRKRGGDDSKKTKENTKYFGGSTQKMAKLKSSAAAAAAAAHSPAPSQHTDDSLDAVPYFQSNHAPRENPKMVLPKNDTPNKFWLSVEPYCMPITQEDIKLLDDLLEEYAGPLVPPTPELGPHFSTQWAAEDLKEEQDNSNANAKLNKRFTAGVGGGGAADVMNLLKKGEKLMGDGVTGPLTQRLMASFLEENMVPGDLEIGSENASDTNPTTANSGDATMALLKNGINIERRIKRELIEQGFLDADDFTAENEDEILAEIVRVRTELSAIAEHNHGELQKLKAAAREETKRLEIKRKLDSVDQDIIEMYKKVVAIKAKRRVLTDQERDEVFRLTVEQKRLSDLLDSMPAPGPNFSAA